MARAPVRRRSSANASEPSAFSFSTSATMSSRVMPRVTPRASRVSPAPRGRVLSRLAPTVRATTRRGPRVRGGLSVRAVAFVPDPADGTNATSHRVHEKHERRRDVSASLSARPPLQDYPPHRSRLSLALDPYSRMSLPDRRGNGEVQKRPTSDVVWGALCCFFTISVLGLVDVYVKHVFGGNTPFMSGAWGTISVLAFGTLENPAARWYNCVVATVFSTMAVAAIVGTLGVSWYSRALAMSVALAFMMLTGSVHPPGAAAIMACMDQKALQDLGLAYVAYPVLFGSLFVLAMGRLCARLKREREFVLLWRWKSPFRGKSGNRSSRSVRSFLFGIVSIEKRKGHPVLYRRSAYGFKRPPEFLRAAGLADAAPAAAAIVAAEAADSGGKSVRDALNDALNDEPRRLSMDDRRPERALLARVDESRIETEGTVTYSF